MTPTRSSVLRRTGGLVAVATLLAAGALTGCGGNDDSGDAGSGGRPSRSEVADAIESGTSVLGKEATVTGFTDAQRDCVAKVLVDSDLSDDALRAFVKGDEGFEGTEQDRTVLSGLGTDVAQCASAK